MEVCDASGEKHSQFPIPHIPFPIILIMIFWNSRRSRFSGATFLAALFLMLVFPSGFEGTQLHAAALPEFPLTQHELPPTETPMTSFTPHVEALVTLVLYLIALALGTLAVYHFRSRRQIFFLTVAAMLLFGFWLHGCVCPAGSFQNIVAGLFLEHYYISLPILLIFLTPILVSIFYGRVFCSCVCPLGAVQEIVAVKPVHIPLWLEHSLGLVRYFYLGLAVVFASTGLSFLVCQYDPFVGIFRFGGNHGVLIFGGILLLLGVFVARPYCRFLCPYGAILGLCSHLAMKTVRVTPGECTNCQLCESICPYEAIRKPTVEPDAVERRLGPVRVLVVLACVPLILAFFSILGYQSAMPIARQHRDVRLAELLHAEETGIVPERGTFRETRAFQKVLDPAVSDPSEEQYQQAANIYHRVRTAMLYFGFWVGLVISVKLVALTLRRKRTEYEVDPTRCIACGRCFWYCPNQREQRVFLEGDLPDSHP